MSDVGEGDAQQQAAAMSAAQARRAQEKAARKAAKKQVGQHRLQVLAGMHSGMLLR
jgi:class 3 adenylate cyclase